MNNDPGIGNTNAIDDALLEFFVEQRSLPNVDANAHLRRADVVQRLSHILLLLVDKLLEIDIDLPLASSLVHCLALRLVLLHGFHLGTTLFSLLFDFLNAFHFKFYFCIN
jgi:hypothetical protein